MPRPRVLRLAEQALGRAELALLRSFAFLWSWHDWFGHDYRPVATRRMRVRVTRLRPAAADGLEGALVEAREVQKRADVRTVVRRWFGANVAHPYEHVIDCTTRVRKSGLWPAA